MFPGWRAKVSEPSHHLVGNAGELPVKGALNGAIRSVSMSTTPGKDVLKIATFFVLNPHVEAVWMGHCRSLLHSYGFCVLLRCLPPNLRCWIMQDSTQTFSLRDFDIWSCLPPTLEMFSCPARFKWTSSFRQLHNLRVLGLNLKGIPISDVCDALAQLPCLHTLAVFCHTSRGLNAILKRAKSIRALELHHGPCIDVSAFPLQRMVWGDDVVPPPASEPYRFPPTLQTLISRIYPPNLDFSSCPALRNLSLRGYCRFTADSVPLPASLRAFELGRDCSGMQALRTAPLCLDEFSTYATMPPILLMARWHSVDTINPNVHKIASGFAPMPMELFRVLVQLQVKEVGLFYMSPDQARRYMEQVPNVRKLTVAPGFGLENSIQLFHEYRSTFRAYEEAAQRIDEVGLLGMCMFDEGQWLEWAQ